MNFLSRPKDKYLQTTWKIIKSIVSENGTLLLAIHSKGIHVLILYAI